MLEAVRVTCLVATRGTPFSAGMTDPGAAPGGTRRGIGSDSARCRTGMRGQPGCCCALVEVTG